MIDQSSLKAPGWQRVVAELNAAAGDDRAYFERLVRIIAQVSAARQAVLLVPDRLDGEEVEPKVEFVWPPPGAAGYEGVSAEGAPGAKGQGEGGGVEFLDDVKAAARAAFSTVQARAFSLDQKTDYYDGSQQSGFLLAIPFTTAATRGGGPGGAQTSTVVAGAVVTLLIESRGKDAVRSTMAMGEVLAGYFQSHLVRQALRRTQAAGFALDLATRLIAAVNTSPTFKGACIQLSNDLAKQFALDRVALGWVKSDSVYVQAISDTEHFDKRMAMVEKLRTAMDECLDQEQPVLFPPPSAQGNGGDVLLSQAIVHSHRELAAGNANLTVCSLPIRVDEEVVGVLTLESLRTPESQGFDAPSSLADPTRSVGVPKPARTATGGAAIDLATIELLQAAMDLVGPVLKIRRSDDRALPARAWQSFLNTSAMLVGPRHTAWKVAGVAVMALLLFVTFYQTTYRPGAKAQLEPRTKRMVSMPFDGVLKTLGEKVEPGERVIEGQVLIELDTSELKLGLADAQAKINEAVKQASAARKTFDQTKVEMADSQAEQARSQAELYRSRIERSTIKSPITGMVLAGDLKDKVGSTVKTGEGLLQIAPLDDLIVVARVDERDIKLVRDAFEKGTGTGTLATKTRPGEHFPFVVERIVPMAMPGEGANVFEVRARLVDPPADWLRPGMEGIAKFDTERRPLIWIGTRRLIDAVRLWLW